MEDFIKNLESQLKNIAKSNPIKFDLFPDKNLGLFPELKQVKFPKSKKKRIRKKWKKNKKNFTTVMIEKFLIIGNKIILREETYQKLKSHYQNLAA